LKKDNMLSAQSNSLAQRLKARPFIEVVESLALWATNNELPFVVYRLPNQKYFNFLIGSEISKVNDEGLASIASGFLVSTYEGDQYFINNGISLNSNNQEISISATWPSNISLDSIGEVNEAWKPCTIENDAPETNKEEYIQQVKDSIDEINNSDLLKVVPSRIKRVKLSETESLLDIFNNLCDAYSNAFVSLLSTPKLGTWIGATPETLIEVDNEGVFKTMSLAGTQKFTDEQPLHALPWTQKEIEEQAMVSRYIINRFKEIRLREFEEVGPRTVKAGNLVHLCSTFTVDTEATDYADLGSTMLKLLHPTSAVCGMPKPLAKALIKKLEKHQRKLYSGYLGPVNMVEGSHIYVNLRCMEVLKSEGILYAGAGVTAYSVAEDEWWETELKCNTLLNIIHA
jgi:isochorismate synthase